MTLQFFDGNTLIIKEKPALLPGEIMFFDELQCKKTSLNVPVFWQIISTWQNFEKMPTIVNICIVFIRFEKSKQIMFIQYKLSIQTNKVFQMSQKLE